jgi:YVTN family beta-propeller protein
MSSKYQMPDNDVVEIDVASLSITRYFTNVGTINLGIAVRPDNGDLYVANTEARNLVHFEPVLRGHAVDNRITEITIGTGARTFYDLNPGTDYGTLPNLRAMTNALAQPAALVFDPSGNFFYVAAFGTDRIASVDKNGNILARIDVGHTAGSLADPRHKRGPRGLALNAGAQRLYAFNRIANSISIIDTAALSVVAEIPVGSFDPTPAVIRNGRGFLYDAKLSGNGTISCASCHVDAEMDLLAWDLGDPGGVTTPVTLSVTNGTGTNVIGTFVFQSHPMKGPLTTQTLRGLQGNEPFHWRGEKTNFLAFASTFNTLLGAATNLAEADQVAFRDFINTLTFEPNPNQNLDRTYPTNFAGGNAAAGLQSFKTQPLANCGLCIVCHLVPPGSGSLNLIPPSNEEGGLPQNFKRPQLRDLYQRMGMATNAGAASLTGFGLMHDGEQPSLISFLSRPFFSDIPGNVRTNLNAFLQCFDNGTAPAVGYTRTVTPSNLNSTIISNDWLLLETQASGSNIDLVVKGTIDGKFHGLLYQPASANYRVDTTNAALLTRAQLQAKVLAGDTLNLTGVPPGSGGRMAIDRDSDGILDGDVPSPKLQVVLSSGNVVLSWPYSAAGYVLKTSASLSPTAPWTNVSGLVEIVGTQNMVTNTPPSEAGFYRLRLP